MNFWNANVQDFEHFFVWIPNVTCHMIRQTIWISVQYLDDHLNSSKIKLVDYFIKMPSENQTVQDRFWQFKYQTSLVFRC
jgi:hypothetical protein